MKNIEFHMRIIKIIKILEYHEVPWDNLETIENILIA